MENGLRNEATLPNKSTVRIPGLPPLCVPAALHDYMDVVVAYPLSKWGKTASWKTVHWYASRKSARL